MGWRRRRAGGWWDGGLVQTLETEVIQKWIQTIQAYYNININPILVAIKRIKERIEKLKKQLKPLETQMPGIQGWARKARKVVKERNAEKEKS